MSHFFFYFFCILAFVSSVLAFYHVLRVLYALRRFLDALADYRRANTEAVKFSLENYKKSRFSP